MLVERGGRPLHMVDGRPKVTTDKTNADYGGQVGWSASAPFYWTIHFHDVGMNHDNELGSTLTMPAAHLLRWPMGRSRFFLNQPISFRSQ